MKSPLDIALEAFGGNKEYRGYTLIAAWVKPCMDRPDRKVLVAAYMENSPLHPLDGMEAYNFISEEDWRYAVSKGADEQMIEAYVTDATLHLKGLIDSAHDDSGKVKEED